MPDDKSNMCLTLRGQVKALKTRKIRCLTCNRPFRMTAIQIRQYRAARLQVARELGHTEVWGEALGDREWERPLRCATCSELMRVRRVALRALRRRAMRSTAGG